MIKAIEVWEVNHDFTVNLQQRQLAEEKLRQHLSRSNAAVMKVTATSYNEQNIGYLVATARKLLAGHYFTKSVHFIVPADLIHLFSQIIERQAIACLGDSITFGFPWGPSQSWVKLAGAIAGKETINLGVNGDSTLGMRERFFEEVVPLKPAYVHLLGANDAWLGLNTDVLLQNIDVICSSALEEGICPILAPPLPINAAGTPFFDTSSNLEHLLREYSKCIVNYARKHNIPLINYASVMGQGESEWPDPTLYYDQVHPNKNGYEAMAGKAGKFFAMLK